MKRIHTLFALLSLVSAVAWADITLDLTKTYYIQAVNGGAYVKLNTSGNATLSASPETAFEIAVTEGGYTIHADNGYLIGSGWDTKCSSEAKAWTIAETDQGYLISQEHSTLHGKLGFDSNAAGSPLYCNKGNFYFQFVDASVQRAKVTYIYNLGAREWCTEEVLEIVGNTVSAPPAKAFATLTYDSSLTVAADGTTTVEVTCTPNLPFTAFESASAITQWYAFRAHNNSSATRWIYDNAGALGFHQGDHPQTADYAWGFVGNLIDGFEIVNKKSGLILSDENPCTLGTAHNRVTLCPSNANSAGFAMKTTGQYYNYNSNNAIVRWGDADNGSTFFVEAMTVEEQGYTVSMTGLPDDLLAVATISVGGRDYGQGDVITGALGANDVEVSPIPGYHGAVSIEGETLVVTYTVLQPRSLNVTLTPARGTTVTSLSTIRLDFGETMPLFAEDMGLTAEPPVLTNGNQQAELVSFTGELDENMKIVAVATFEEVTAEGNWTFSVPSGNFYFINDDGDIVPVATITANYAIGTPAEPIVITYIYKNGETEWLREEHSVEVGAKYPELRAMPSGVSIADMPVKILNGTVSTSEELEIQVGVDETFDVPFSTSYENATWLYATVHGSNKYYWGYDSSSKRVKTNQQSFGSIKANNAYKWAIVGNPITGFKLMNKAAGSSMILTSASPKDDGNTGGNTFPVMTASNNIPQGNNTYWTINAYNGPAYGYLISRDGESINLNRRGADLAYWTGTDDGSRIGFFPVDEAIVPVTPPAENGKSYQYRNYRTGYIITNVSGMTISQARNGRYHLSSTGSITNTPAVFYVPTGNENSPTTVWSSLSSFAEWIYEEVSAGTEEIVESPVNSLTSGKYYRLTSYIEEARSITDSNNKLFAYPTDPDNPYNNIWLFTKSGSNWTMKNLYSGNYVQSSKSDAAYTTGNSAATIVVTEKGTKDDGRKYFLLAPSNAATGYFNNSKGNQSYKIVSWGDTNDNSNYWYLVQVEVTPEMIAAAAALKVEDDAKAGVIAQAGTYNTTLRTYFSDNACTQLKNSYQTMTDDALRTTIGSTLPDVLKEMIVCVKNDKWDSNATKNYYVKGFRIHDYDIYSDPGVWNNITKVGGFSNLYHPTGVTCKNGELLYIMVGSAPKDSDAKLELGITPATNNGPAQTVTLQEGLNIVKATIEGEAFILYRLTNSEKYLKDYPNITVHIEGGEASGCFDMHRGMTNNDWNFLCSNMFTNKYLHLMAENTAFCVESDRVRGAGNITGSLKIWDFIFMAQERLIGHDGQWDGRYNPVVVARDQYSGNPNWSGVSANYSGIWKDGLLNYNSLLNGDRWVIYHEEAHGHQYPINLAATTESSNNGFAQMVNFEFGLTSRRADGTKTLMTFKNDGLTWVDILRGGEGANRGRKYYEESLWLQNHLFYQLYLYFHVQGHMPDFWPRLCDKMRANGGLIKSANVNNPTLYSNDYLKFARACAEVSKTDLYEFFDAYGFFGYYDDVFVGNDIETFYTQDVDATAVRFVGDYGRYFMKMPKKGNQADEDYLAELKSFMHSQPNKAPNIMFIDDHIKERTVADSAFAVTLDPSLLGQPVKFYDNGTKKQGDIGDFTDFNGVNQANNIDYTISGTTVTVTGSGMVGMKIYDENGNLKCIYNTTSFTVKDDIATKLQNGTYTLVAALADQTNLPLAKPGVATCAVELYNGTADDHQTYQASDTQINANIPYTANNGKDFPTLTENAILRIDAANNNSLPQAFRSRVNTIYKVDGEWEAPHIVLTDKKDYYAPEDFVANEAHYERTNTAGLNSVCMPFSITADLLPEGSKIYVLSNVGETALTFTETDATEPGEFCLVDCPDDTPWNISVPEDSYLTGTPADDANSVGSFQNGTVGAGHYKLNGDGTKFGITTDAGKVTAFRGYIDAPAAAAAKSLAFSLEKAPEGIEGHLSPTGRKETTDNRQQSTPYDLNGRQLSSSKGGLILQRGQTYIINGQKMKVR
ncbi:MAG: M60 family metallopeptidase [Bacteroidaceae bacterium]|nr:M60 family metallopeptidase [Bacteroidaceae bacterium]